MDYDIGNFIWKWKQPQIFNNENVFLDGDCEWITFFPSSEDEDGLVVSGDTSLKHDFFHCWTVQIEETMDAEIKIGIAIMNEDLGKKCLDLGSDDNSWVISNNGCISHKNDGAIHDNWRFYSKDHVTLFFNGPERKLSFALNGNHLGVEFCNLPNKSLIYPVVGVSSMCSLRLKSSHQNPMTLELRCLLTHLYSKCLQKSKGTAASFKPQKLPVNLKIVWLRPLPMKSDELPVGLRKVVKSKYPWYAERNTHRTRRNFTKRIVERDRKCAFSPPSMVVFGAKRSIGSCCGSSIDSDASRGQNNAPRISKSKRRRTRRKEKAKKVKQPSVVDDKSEEVCSHNKCLRLFHRKKRDCQVARFCVNGVEKAPLK